MNIYKQEQTQAARIRVSRMLVNSNSINIMLKDFHTLEKDKQSEIIWFLLIRFEELSFLTPEIINIIVQLCTVLRSSKLEPMFIILTLFQFKQVLVNEHKGPADINDILYGINVMIMDCVILNISTENEFISILTRCMSRSSIRRDFCLHCFDFNFGDRTVYILGVPIPKTKLEIAGEKYHELLNIVNRRRYTGPNWGIQLKLLQERFNPRRDISRSHFISELPIRLLTGSFLVFCILNDVSMENYDFGNNYRITCFGNSSEFDITFYIYPGHTIVECFLIRGYDLIFRQFRSFLEPYENIPSTLCVTDTPDLLRSFDFPFQVFCPRGTLKEIKMNGLKILEVLQLFISSVRLRTLNYHVVPVIFLFWGSDFVKIDFFQTIFATNNRIMVR